MTEKRRRGRHENDGRSPTPFFESNESRFYFEEFLLIGSFHAVSNCIFSRNMSPWTHIFLYIYKETSRHTRDSTSLFSRFLFLSAEMESFFIIHLWRWWLFINVFYSNPRSSPRGRKWTDRGRTLDRAFGKDAFTVAKITNPLLLAGKSEYRRVSHHFSIAIVNRKTPVRFSIQSAPHWWKGFSTLSIVDVIRMTNFTWIARSCGRVNRPIWSKESKEFFPNRK